MMTLAARRAARTATARMGSEVVFIASESRDFHAKHHAAIFMLEIVAMEQIRLRALKRHREAECHTNALPGPDEHRVLAAEIGSQSAVFVDCKRVNEIRRRFPLEYLEMKAMQIDRVRRVRLPSRPSSRYASDRMQAIRAPTSRRPAHRANPPEYRGAPPSQQKPVRHAAARAKDRHRYR